MSIPRQLLTVVVCTLLLSMTWGYFHNKIIKSHRPLSLQPGTEGSNRHQARALHGRPSFRGRRLESEHHSHQQTKEVYFLLILNKHLSLDTLYEIPDNNTLQELRQSLFHHPIAQDAKSVAPVEYSDSNQLLYMDYALLTSLYTNITLLPSVHFIDSTPDDCMRVAMAKLHLLQPVQLIYDLYRFGEYVNPSVTLWNDALFLVEALSVSLRNRMSLERVNYQWLNSSLYWPTAAQFPPGKERYLGLYFNETIGLSIEIIGQDPRVIIIDDSHASILMTNRYAQLLRMGMINLRVNSDNCPNPAKRCEDSYLDIESHYVTLVPDTHLNEHHKNWAPYLLNGTVYLLQYLNPLHVVKVNQSSIVSVAEDDKKYLVTMETVSIGQINDFSHWESHYGIVRGGSNAIPIGRNGGLYLSFFHSSVHLPKNYFKTYFMGAFVFQTSPYMEMKLMSQYPIVDKQLYDGEFDRIYHRRIDYAVFPMSIYLEDDKPVSGMGYPHNPLEKEYPGVIVLTFGHNDLSGYMARIKLSTLMATMIDIKPIENKDEQSTQS